MTRKERAWKKRIKVKGMYGLTCHFAGVKPLDNEKLKVLKTDEIAELGAYVFNKMPQNKKEKLRDYVKSS